MKHKLNLLILLGILLNTYGLAQTENYQKAFDKVQRATNHQELKLISERTSERYRTLMALADELGWLKELKNRSGEIIAVLSDYIKVENNYIPKYKTLDNNGGTDVNGLPNGASVVTNNVDLYSGGLLGLDLSGNNLQIAIWDGGSVQANHQEFIGRLTNNDAGPAHFHATHVAGTMAAAGVVPEARGMAFNANLQSYDWNDDLTEIAAQASAGLLISNHSYGPGAGWSYDTGLGPNDWFWFGGMHHDEDYSFGYYSSEDQTLDDIAYNAPYYTSVWAAGNPHNLSPYYYNFPSNTPYDTWDMTTGMVVPNAGTIGTVAAPAKNTQMDPYGYHQNMAKNVITVANVNYEDLSSPVKNTSSAPGGQNEWRIKPDIATKGTDVYSTYTPNFNSYDQISGTSMAAPVVSGSLLLLQEHYHNLNASFMRSATLKAVAIHGADDHGTLGPDYLFGWGLLNTSASAQLITNNGVSSFITENNLLNGSTEDLVIHSDGTEPLKVTISWTDVPGNPTTIASLADVSNAIDDPSPKLINDLDIILTHSDGTIYEPFVMDITNPLAPFAVNGNNSIDNVEQIYIATPPAGEYTISVSHKGALVNGQQNYSLVASGLGQTAYCDSQSEDTGAYIFHVSLYNLIPNNMTGDDGGYGDYTDQIANVQIGETYPLRFGADYNGPVVSVYWRAWIDYNGDSNFDMSEMIGEAITNSNDRERFYFTIPIGATIGSEVRMRIIASLDEFPEPCGNYLNGETEDYSIIINNEAANFEQEKEMSIDAKYNDSFVYPNPARLELNIIFENDQIGQNAKIIDASSGKLMKSFNIVNNKQSVNISNLPNGTYVLKTSVGNTIRFKKE